MTHSEAVETLKSSRAFIRWDTATDQPAVIDGHIYVEGYLCENDAKAAIIVLNKNI